MCKHESVRRATSADMQDICLECGKVFHNENRFEQALSAYKSGAVRSMLSLAKSLVESV